MILRKLTAPMVTAAFATAASFSALGVIDLDGATDQVVTVASETLTTAVDGNGRNTFANAATTIADVVVLAGYGTSALNTTYYRFDLTGAVFGAAARVLFTGTPTVRWRKLGLSADLLCSSPSAGLGRVLRCTSFLPDGQCIHTSFT